MADFHYESNDFQNMEKVLEEGCDTLLSGEDEINEWNSYNIFLLGRLKLTLDKCEESKNIFYKVLQFENESFGIKSNETARTHNYIAKSYFALGEYEAAMKQRRICFEINVRDKGLIHLDTISVGLDLVQDYKKMKNQDQAQTLFLQLKQAVEELDDVDETLREKMALVHKSSY